MQTPSLPTSDAPLSTPSELPSGRFSSREDFRQMVRDALATAVREGWQEIIFSDANFHDWPLGERAVADLLQEWAHGSRRFLMLAGSYDDVVRRHARFVRWRGTWDHIITCRRSPSADPLDIRIPGDSPWTAYFPSRAAAIAVRCATACSRHHWSCIVAIATGTSAIRAPPLRSAP